MSRERDELRADLLDEHGYCVNCGEDTEDCECGFGEFIDAAVAAGWRKPRVVTTAEELDALPVGSVVRDEAGDVAVRAWADKNGWRCWSEIDYMDHCADALDAGWFLLPATVLHEGAQP